MLVGVGIVFGKLIALPARAHHMTPVQTRHPRAAVTAFLDIVFTFGGQVSASHLPQLCLACSRWASCCRAVLDAFGFSCHVHKRNHVGGSTHFGRTCCLQGSCCTGLQCNLL